MAMALIISYRRAAPQDHPALHRPTTIRLASLLAATSNFMASLIEPNKSYTYRDSRELMRQNIPAANQLHNCIRSIFKLLFRVLSNIINGLYVDATNSGKIGMTLCSGETPLRGFEPIK